MTPVNNNGSIVKRMADFKKMRQLTEYIDKNNMRVFDDPFLIGFSNEDESLMAVKRKDLVKDFSETRGIKATKTISVLKQAVHQEYVEYLPKPNPDEKLRVTGKGEKFIFKRFNILPTGMWREIAEDNYKPIALIISFVSGVIVAVIIKK